MLYTACIHKKYTAIKKQKETHCYFIGSGNKIIMRTTALEREK